MAKRVHDIELKFIASLKDYEAKLAEMPGMTEKQVKKASNRFLKEWKSLQKGLKKTTATGAASALGKFGDESKKAAEQLKDFEDRAGEADSILAALGGGLSEISPKAGAFVQAFAEGASVIEATARSGTGLVKMLGPLAIAVGAGALAYRELSLGIEEANQKIETQKGKLDQVEAMHRAVKEAALLHRLAIGEITEAQFAEIGAAQKANDLFGPMLAEMNIEKEELANRLNDERKALAALEVEQKRVTKSQGIMVMNTGLASQAIETSESKVASLEASYAALETRIGHTEGAQERYRKDLNATTTAEKNTKGLEKRVDLLEQYEDQLKASADLVEGASLQMPTLDVDMSAFQKLATDYRGKLADVETAYSENAEALDDIQKKQFETAKDLGKDTTQLLAEQLAEREKLEANYHASRNIVFENSEKAAQDFINETSTMLEDELDKFAATVSKFAPASSIFEKTKATYEKQFSAFEASTLSARSSMDELHKAQIEAAEGTGQDLLSVYQNQAADLLSFEQNVADGRQAIQDKANAEMAENYIEAVETATAIGLAIINELADHQMQKSAENAERLRLLLENEDAQLTADQKKNIEARLAEEQKMADKLFRLQQAAAIASIIMDTAAGMMKAVKQLGPLFGAIAAAGVGIMGGVQAGVVLSQKPPKFHTGGAISDRAPDELDIRVTRPEMVLNAIGASTLGRDTVSAANSGRGLAQNQTVVVQWRNRVLDVVTSDIARRPSPIRSAIRRSSRSGHRRS